MSMLSSELANQQTTKAFKENRWSLPFDRFAGDEPQMVEEAANFPVTSVENLARWLTDVGGEYCISLFYGPEGFLVCDYHLSYRDHPDQTKSLEFIRSLYDKKIGELGNSWSSKGEGTPIEFKYAKIKFGDVVDYYTTSDGVLKVPGWTCLKYAVDEYLEEAPRFKFHPSRVRQFIAENGIDSLDQME